MLQRPYLLLKNSWRYATEWKSLGIKPTDLVLEIGGGDKPMPRSDVLVDKFLVDNTERGEAIIVDRPSVVGDAERLPFQDGAFDYVFSSNLVEHLENPEFHLAEIARIGKRGCIICPASLFEKLRGTRFHRWFVSVEGKQLVFQEKERAVFDEELLDFYNALGGLDASCFDENRHKFLLRFFWEGSIPNKVIRVGSTSDGFIHAQVGHDMPRAAKVGGLRRVYVQLTGKVIRWMYSRRSVSNLIELLACPVCQGSIESDSQHSQLRCRVCARQFAWAGPVPVMLEENL